MSNHAWVCFDCRRAVRRPANAGNVRCPSCAAPCEYLGHKVPIPPRAKLRAWAAMRERFYAWRRNRLLQRHQMHAGRLGQVHRQIAHLTSLPPNEGRLMHLRRLRRELERLHGL